MFRKLVEFTKECEQMPSFAVENFLSAGEFDMETIRQWSNCSDDGDYCYNLYWTIQEYIEKEHEYYKHVWHRSFFKKWKLYRNLKRIAVAIGAILPKEATEYVIFLAKSNKVVQPNIDEWHESDNTPIILLKDITDKTKEQARIWFNELLGKFPYLQHGVDEISKRENYLLKHRINQKIRIYTRLKNGNRSFIFTPIVKMELQERANQTISLTEFLVWLE